MKTTKLYRKSFYNPFFIQGFYEIGKITFFKDNNIVAEISQGWFNELGSNNSYKEIILPFEVRRRNKINLNRKEAFIISYSDFSGKKSNLFINTDLLKNVEIKKHVKKYSSSLDTCYSDIITFSVHGIKSVYVKENNKYIERYIENDYLIKEGFNHTFEKNEKGKYIQNICNKAKEQNINLSSYQVEKLLNIFDITLKK